MALVAAAFSTRGRAALLALDCPPISEGGTSPGRLVIEADLPPGEYSGRWIEDEKTQESVTVSLPEGLEAGIHRGVFIGVRRGS